MTFLCLSRVLINTAHIVAILTEGADYTIQTSRTYASQYSGGVVEATLNYSYPEHFTVPKESPDGAIIRSWVACQSLQVWPNATQQRKQEKKQPQPQQQKQRKKESAPPAPPAPVPEITPIPQEVQDVDALLHEASTKHEDVVPRHVSLALRRLNEHFRNSPGVSPSMSRSASPFRPLKGSAVSPQ